jgi:small-conductance mechanosensitive channel
MPDLKLEFLDYTFFGNSLLQWTIALVVLLLSYLLLQLAVRIAGRRLAALATGTETQWDDIIANAINRTRTLFLFVAGIFISSHFLQLPERTQSFIYSLFIITLLVQAGIWLGVVTLSTLEQYRQQALKKNPAAATTINAMGFLSRILIWSVVLLVALDNLGIDVTALVAGLGIGGVAVALSVQNILGDLFASLSIILDKPFVIGDFLVIDDCMGSVEYVGLKTTRVRSLSGEQLILSNSDLLKSRIRNYGRMFERRVVFNIGVTYDTTREKLRRIPAIIREAIESQDKTRFDRSHFMKYGDYALQFETVYYVLSPDYNLYMDRQQAIYFAIHEAFEQEHIEFAYPTQTLYVTKNAGVGSRDALSQTSGKPSPGQSLDQAVESESP